MFPIMLENMDEAKIFLVGGGHVAYHKVLNLHRFGIHPTIVSPEFHPSFAELELQGMVTLITKEAEWEDVANAFLTLLVTDNEAVNDYLAKKLKDAGKLVVHASNPSLGTAQIPAVTTRGKLIISVSTSGASPSLAKKIRTEIAETYDERYEDYLDFLADIRYYVKQFVTDRVERRTWLKEAIEPIYLHNVEERQTFLDELKQTFPAEQTIS
ncbi:MULTISPECIES: bifunctional precorrin-2 dehydrogenase/sirohydrochlorin ferrochelatase [unclassified Sporosarcina]|uniref:precorrin-2 dehydrogenase/sirohydrochlorin ferrochelatase family protein n=1 Tax=unclassified Sporosarcina TaxID=2647733 RepID=UPI000C16E0AC|nr:MULTISPECIES: NAD(P)-dependent oxidoreductase [unclassified Sporosarcina]PID04774.1 siroheme synthase [Sporosarcina sp. P30]PID07928.1 siroheme synthase [Sporosarcina sp. P31]PID11114.1 siroheme synthase [Sporosarcina sp. P32b]